MELTVKKERNSSIELLRIVAMLFIILSHLCVHNGISLSQMPPSLNKTLMQWGTLGNLGVDIFVLISGYFLSTLTFKRRRLIELLTEVWLYSAILAALSFFVFDIVPGQKAFLKICMPTVFAEYWFFSAYVVLLLLSPFLNLLIERMSRADFKRLLLILLSLWVLIPTATTQLMYGNEIAQLILFYLIGAYFRKHPDNLFEKKRVRVLCTAVFWVLLLFSSVFIDHVAAKLFPSLAGHGLHFFSRNSLFVVGIAVGMFASAVYRKPFTNRFINTVASCTFGVYLLHDNHLFRQALWTRIFPIKAIYGSPLFPLYAVLIVFTVLSACTVIEWIRQKTVAAPISRAVDRLVEKAWHGIRRLARWLFAKGG